MGEYCGIYRALVMSNKGDTDKTGWVRVKLYNAALISQVFWAAPAFPAGEYWVPEPGDRVYVFFEEGNINRPIYIGNWFGRLGESQVPAEVKDNYPKTRMIKTRKGTKIIFEDVDNGEYLKIQTVDKSGGGHHMILLDVQKEEIRVEHSSGQASFVIKSDGSVDFISESIRLVTKDVFWDSGQVGWSGGEKFLLKDRNGNELEMDSGGVKILDKNGNEILLKSGKIEVKVNGEIVLAGGSKGVIRVGDHADSHNHTYQWSGSPGAGVTGPAVVKFSKGSSKVKVG